MIYKRGKTYHYDFGVNGERYRGSLETPDHRAAKDKEKDLVRLAKEGKLATKAIPHARLPFNDAVEKYLDERAVTFSRGRQEYISRDTVRQERAYFKALSEKLGAKKLKQIRANDFREYQTFRLQQGRHPSTFKHEARALLRLLKWAGLSIQLGDVQLPTITSEPREMLTAAEKQHLFETAASKPEWQTAYCAALLTANTSMRPKELMRLLWSDLDPFSRLITVRRSKTEAGKRVIPLNDEAWSAIAAMKKRDDALGAYAPEHYIFCRQRPQINPTRPMSGWRSAWRSLRKAAGMPKFRYYDLRHQCITEMLEAGIPEGVIREVAGHVDPAMTKHYSHPRLAARRAAVEALATVMGNVETGRGPDMPPGPQRALNGLLPTRLNKNPSTRYGLLSRWNKSPSTQQTVLGPLCQR